MTKEAAKKTAADLVGWFQQRKNASSSWFQDAENEHKRALVFDNFSPGAHTEFDHLLPAGAAGGDDDTASDASGDDRAAQAVVFDNFSRRQLMRTISHL